MEKIPAACAMGWSIELEKSLRSKNPTDKSTESIRQLGPRLELWNKEPIVSMAAYKMFGLIPGEDRLFLNAILLRVADAFRSGTKEIKVCIFKMFLQELKDQRRGRRDTKGGGIFSENKLENCLEILSRVKMVFDEGDVLERALALGLFGCWADFVSSNADIRYIVLSSLVSEHVLEVKASLFAAGLFCELADDFSAVLLEILDNMLTSPETILPLKIAGARAFSKLSCSFSLAKRAHLTGRKLLLSSANERFSSAMLVSLTKIASKWTMMIPEQIELLFSFLKDNLDIETTTLNCLRFILAKGICPCSATTDKIQHLINILDESQHPRDLHNQTLKVLHKIVFYNFPILPCSVILEFSSMLLKGILKTLQSSLMSTRLLAFGVLVDISEIFLRRAQTELCKVDFSLVSQVICMTMNHMSIFIESKLCTHEAGTETYQEVMRLLSLLSNLVEIHPDIDCFLVDKLCAFLEHVVNVLGKETILHQEGNVDLQILKLGEEKMTILLLKVALRVAIMITGLTVATSDVMNRVHNLLKLLMEKSHMSAKAKAYIIRLYMLLFESDGNNRGLCQGTTKCVNSVWKSSPCGDSFSPQGFLNLNCVMKLFESRDFWSCYMAGKFAACQGSWCTAACVFEQLTPMVQSDFCSSWLKSLTLFSSSESRIQSLALGLPKDIIGEDTKGITWKGYLSRYAEIIMGTCHALRAAKVTLDTAVIGTRFSFQVWFLSLRVKVLETWADICTLLDTISFIQVGSSVTKEELVSTSKLIPSQGLGAFMHSFMKISCRLKRIAQEFDLMTASVIDMDRDSVMLISALALSCLVLAFSLTFALSIPNLSSKEYESCGLDIAKEQHCVNLTEELLGRLGSVDSESCQALWKLLKIYKKPGSCFYPRIHNHGAKISGETKDYVELCRYSIMEIVRLRNESSVLCCSEGFSCVSFDGLQLLWNIFAKLIQIPLRTPKRFFLVRPYASSELYVMNEEGQNLVENPVISGSHFQLNLCLQLRNMPEDQDLSFHVSKLYCILSFTRISQKDNVAQSSCRSSCQMELDDNIIDLNEALLGYASDSVNSNACSSVLADDSYISFDHNERGQGFATLLLDMSGFPVGNYRIKWLSCCIDSEGSYWSLLPLNYGPVFSVVGSS